MNHQGERVGRDDRPTRGDSVPSTGTTAVRNRRRYRDDRERITRNIRVDGAGCWRWQLATTYGYGRVHDSAGRMRIAHRFAYEMFVGPIPETLTLDHLCRVPDCVNPDHLDPVSIGVNLHRSPHTIQSINTAKTECPSGHPYDEINTYYPPSRPGVRYCRACKRDRRKAAA